MRTVLLAAIAYFLVAIILGFALGVARVTVVAPHTGSIVAVLLELPVMLAATWVACGAIIASLKVGAALTERLLMGVIALALVLGAEFGIAMWVQGRTAMTFLQSFASVEGALGLCAQIAFALFPAIQRIKQER